MESITVVPSDLTQEIVRDDTLVIRTGTALDNTNAHEMVDMISSAQNKGFRFIVVDMTALEFLSSAGVGSILGTVEISREAGGDIILCQVSDPIMHVLQVLDLAEFLTIKPDRQRALTVCGVTE
jgi:anti-anti-sigma factor